MMRNKIAQRNMNTYHHKVINRVPLCMSPRRNWDSPTPPSSHKRVCPSPLNQMGREAHSPAGEGVPIPTTGEKAEHSAIIHR